MIGGVRSPDVADKTVLIIDLNLYSLAAIKKSCYKFTDRCSVFLKEGQNNELQLVFDFPKGTNKSAIQETLYAFCNELLDQDLRETIATETEATRNLILAQAFSKISLLDK